MGERNDKKEHTDSRPNDKAILSIAADHHGAGRWEAAKSLYLEILARDPRQPQSLHGLALIAEQAGSLPVAVKMIRRAIAADPGNDDFAFCLARMLQAGGTYSEALQVLRSLLKRRPDHLLARFRLGNILQLEGNLDAAIAVYEEIVALHPDSGDAQFNIGNVRRLQGRLGDARRSYQRALEIDPDSVDALWNLGLLDLLEGDYAAGWPRYEIRHRRPTHGLRSFPQPQWKGEPLEGRTILLHAEQGLGDTLQFLRYVPLVVERGGVVLLDVPPQIRRLAAEIPGVARLIGDGEPAPRFDCHCPMMSLPLAFSTRASNIPSRVPYLRVPAAAAHASDSLKWPERGIRVGLVWGATPRFFEDSDRSIAFSLFEPLFALDGFHFFALQMGHSASQLDSGRFPITDLGNAIGDFADTAALVGKLHLVVTVDTSVAHVAGALGRPTWILLPFAADWRWFVDREDSPWYPTARLFRQPQPRDWPAVIARVCRELQLLAEKEPFGHGAEDPAGGQGRVTP